jgi:hypothetical protein
MNDENIINVAPSQDYKPLALFQDQNNDVIIPHYFLEYFKNLQFWPNFNIIILFNGNSCRKIIDSLNTYQTYFLRPLRFLYNKSNLPLGSKYVKAS